MIQHMLADLPALLVIVLALVVASLGGWPIAALVLQFSRSPRRARTVRRGREVPVLTTPSEDWSTPELLRGGLWIGLLERLAVVAAVLAGRPEMIAVVVALKGLGRYPELRAHEGASERFLVGTFASLLWSVAVGAVALAVLGALA
jgi:hypothetical protein